MNDSEKTALITGGAGGIGRAMAQALASDGINTVLFDVDGQAAKRAAAQIGEQFGHDRALALVGDVSDESACNEAVASCIDRFEASTY